jgi:hypothetical protein
LDHAGTFKGVRDVSTRMRRENSGACFDFGIGFINEAPKVSERNGLVPKADVGVADARGIGFQVESRSSEELWNLRDTQHLVRAETFKSAFASRASLWCAGEHAECAKSTIESVHAPCIKGNVAEVGIRYFFKGVVSVRQQDAQPIPDGLDPGNVGNPGKLKAGLKSRELGDYASR